jgi:hypothetical protein
MPSAKLREAEDEDGDTPRFSDRCGGGRFVPHTGITRSRTGLGGGSGRKKGALHADEHYYGGLLSEGGLER